MDSCLYEMTVEEVLAVDAACAELERSYAKMFPAHVEVCCEAVKA